MFPIYCSWPACNLSLFESADPEWIEARDFYNEDMWYIPPQHKSTCVVMLRDSYCTPFHVFHLQCISMIPLIDSWSHEPNDWFKCPSGTCDGEYSNANDLFFIPREVYLTMCVELENTIYVDEAD